MTKKEIRDLDHLWADVVKTLVNYRCEHCGLMGGRVEAAHVVGRRHRTTRWGALVNGTWDLAGHCLCHRCHQQYDEHGPMELDILNDTVGVDRKAALQFMARNSVAKYQQYSDIKETLESIRDNVIEYRVDKVVTDVIKTIQ